MDRRIPILESFCQHAREIGAQLVVPDVGEYPGLANHPIAKELGLTSYATWPITAGLGKGDLGVLSVFDNRPRDWTSSDVLILGALARECAAPLQEFLDAFGTETG